MKTQKPEGQAEQVDEATVATNSVEKSKTAFFITPLGGDNTDIRRATDGLIKAVLEPALRIFNIDLVPPHEIVNPGNITRQVVRHILDSDLVIANLTGLNPNVMYELAIRHAKRKPVITIAEKTTSLPFDIAAERTIFYTNDMGGVVELRSRLIDAIPVALKEENPENPIYDGINSSIIQQIVLKEGNKAEAYILDRLDQLADSISYLKNNANTSPSSPGFKDQVFDKPFTVTDKYFIPIEEVVNTSYPAEGTSLKSIGIIGLGDTKFGDMIFHKITGQGSVLIGVGSARGTGVIILRSIKNTLFASLPEMFTYVDM